MPSPAPSRSPLRFLLLLLCLSGLLEAAPPPAAGRIELLRDPWGIPHVFADSDVGAFYGLGVATADERGFQMTYALRIIQGRLAEIVGDRPKGNRREGAVQSDRMMRTLGWTHAAQRIAAQLDAETQSFLQAYCDGVNDSFARQKKENRLHPLFAQLQVTPEPWTPADCLLSWWHVSQFFATDGTRDLFGWRDRLNPRPGRPAPLEPSPQWKDDAAAVVQEANTTEDWRRQVHEFYQALGASPSPEGTAPAGPKFSHAWVVGNPRTTTGAAVLVSDPQTPVRNPSLWMEFHLAGRTFNVRGVGVPGSPGLLIGFNPHVAWGLTALGADQADLFRLETSPDHPDAYRWNNQWRPMTSREELIRVKDAPPLNLRIRETHLGPIMSAFAFRQEGDPEVALKRIPLCETNRDTIQAVFAMMRATNAPTFLTALAGWRFPSANCVFGDAAGQIGYTALGAIPIRSRHALDPNGNAAGPGGHPDDDWRGFIPAPLLPHTLNPPEGYLLSANHRPVASFYPLPLGLSTGSMGDTLRSWRLRERLEQHPGKFKPEDVLAIHFDDVNPARRELVRLALHLRNTRPGDLSEPTRQALQLLEPWLKAGASSDTRQPGATLANRLSTFFRFVNTPLALQFGGGESGLARFLKDAARRIQSDSQAPVSEDESKFIDQVLASAWNQPSEPNPARSRDRSSADPGTVRPLPWFDSLDGFGSLDPARDLQSPPLGVVDGQTILSQAGQSYTQWVPLHDPDQAQSVCPIGHSDRADSPFRTTTLALWGQAKLHPAPLTRPAVERLAPHRTVLAE